MVLSDNSVIFLEDNLIKLFMEYLKNNGWEIDEYCLGHKHGTDIVAHSGKTNMKIIVEAKGTPKNPSEKSASAQMTNYFQQAIGELYQRGHLGESGYWNVILLPYNKKFKGLAERTDTETNYRLNLNYIFMDVNGEVLILG